MWQRSWCYRVAQSGRVQELAAPEVRSAGPAARQAASAIGVPLHRLLQESLANSHASPAWRKLPSKTNDSVRRGTSNSPISVSISGVSRDRRIVAASRSCFAVCCCSSSAAIARACVSNFDRIASLLSVTALAAAASSRSIAEALSCALLRGRSSAKAPCRAVSRSTSACAAAISACAASSSFGPPRNSNASRLANASSARCCTSGSVLVIFAIASALACAVSSLGRN